MKNELKKNKKDIHKINVKLMKKISGFDSILYNITSKNYTF